MELNYYTIISEDKEGNAWVSFGHALRENYETSLEVTKKQSKRIFFNKYNITPNEHIPGMLKIHRRPVSEVSDKISDLIKKLDKKF